MTVRKDITIRQGSNFRLNVQAVDIADLAGYTARMQVRATRDSVIKLVDITSPSGGITLSGNTVLIDIPSATTTAYTWTNGYWDLEVQSGTGVVTRLAEGFASLSKEVTRA